MMLDIYKVLEELKKGFEGVRDNTLQRGEED